MPLFLLAGAVVLCGLAYAGIRLLNGNSGPDRTGTVPGRDDQDDLRPPATTGTSSSRKRVRPPPVSKPPRAEHRLEVHDWLGEVEIGSLHLLGDLEVRLQCSPSLGWHARGGQVMAAFILPGSLRTFRGQHRIPVLDTADYPSIQLAKINRQLVPVFSLRDGAATFDGFFLFDEPSGKFAKCSRPQPSGDRA